MTIAPVTKATTYSAAAKPSKVGAAASFTKVELESFTVLASRLTRLTYPERRRRCQARARGRPSLHLPEAGAYI
jgi:hypothetical protein